MTEPLVLEAEDGTIVVTPSALLELVQAAVERVDGARLRRRRRGVDLQIDAGCARVQLELAARYGTVLPELAREVQDQVASALAGMCGLEVDAVEVSIEELDER